MNTIHLEAVRAFCRIVETGGFGKAAEQLGMAKTTVSGQIQALEEGLGVTLLHRSTRRVSPTADGLAYYETVKPLLEQFDEANQYIATRGQISGRLKIETTAPLGSYLLMPALPEFLRRHPDLQLEIRCSERAVDLIAEGIDCALRGGPVTDPDLVCRRIGQMRFCLCASPDYLANAPALNHPQDLANHRNIGFRFPGSDKLYTCTLHRDGEHFTVETEPVMTFNNADVYTNAALAGLGIVNVPKASVAHYFADGRLAEVLPEWAPDSMPVSLVYPYARHRSARVQAFVDWAVPLFEQNPLWPLCWAGWNQTLRRLG
ncbi:DNA-binding transcriptional LysR family regulator [Neisseria perflava]|uniref:LysR substrate-binding domain-containing protein n=1 Tax=Neisseria perflava TaxID=33053 RepID=UPI00209F4BE5|nr:LysR family transcriptional regulator [Neisseria perflava]MCP1772718.1 DNA-binding transcriptional LysR family regulator [Neisseria perflava]